MSSPHAIDVYQDHLGAQPQHALVQVVYSSFALVGPEADRAILEVSRRNNQAADITGLLIRDGDWFLQVLEGPVGLVPDLMRRIESDPRHRDVHIRFVRLVEERRFGDWTMCSPTLDRAGFDALVGSLESDRSETDRLLAEFVAAGAWPMPAKPRRRLAPEIRSAHEQADVGPFAYLIYTSLASAPQSSESLEQLVDDAWQRNAGRGITGILLHDDGNFLHYIEGGPADVAALRESIWRDGRHRDIVVLQEGWVAQRLFPACPIDIPDSERPLFDGPSPDEETTALRATLAALVRGMR